MILAKKSWMEEMILFPDVLSFLDLKVREFWLR
jgi:hypothetical protein